VFLREANKSEFDERGRYVSVNEWVLDTDGTNLLAIMSHPDVDHTRTISNDIVEIIQV
jgi:DNA-directed RNA polymerase II subunit RPB1